MKKLLVLIMLFVLGDTSRAQLQKVVVLTPGKQNTHPQAVLDSVKSQFPESLKQTLTVLTSESFGKDWNVEINKEVDEIEPLYYEVIIKGEDGTQTMVYDKTGKLLKIKQVIKNADLPEKVLNSLQTKYADWQVTGKEERMTNADKLEVTYKINLKKGALRKTIFLDPEGDIKVALPL